MSRDRWLTLHLDHEPTDSVVERVDIHDDPGSRSFPETIKRHFLAMVARHEEEDPRRDVDESPWLHKYTLRITEHSDYGAVLLRFREG